ncbi:unnamed protein product [Rotaria socialis]|uniref:Uncharacterized protein n=1 Tax=Rotaria socialis TaxID=392032 RepID=A0A821VW54_9BILA|nr:unnamed protein product [Rotaria socialis]CAF4914120.1 unnamed protein product [Rotaria socialis]
MQQYLVVVDVPEHPHQLQNRTMPYVMKKARHTKIFLLSLILSYRNHINKNNQDDSTDYNTNKTARISPIVHYWRASYWYNTGSIAQQINQSVQMHYNLSTMYKIFEVNIEMATEQLGVFVTSSSLTRTYSSTIIIRPATTITKFL